jgi:hypothetical protein
VLQALLSVLVYKPRSYVDKLEGPDLAPLRPRPIGIFGHRHDMRCPAWKVLSRFLGRCEASGHLTRVNRASCVVVCDVTLPEHPGLRAPAVVILLSVTASAVNFCGLSDAPQAHSEVPTVEMLQNKKTAPVSGGSKSFVCVEAEREKVTE